METIEFEGKMYQLKLSRSFFISDQADGLGVRVSGYDIWLLSGVPTQDRITLFHYPGPLLRYLKLGWVNSNDGQLTLSDKGREVIREYLMWYEVVEYTQYERRKKTARFRGKVLRALRNDEVEIADVKVSGKEVEVRWEGSVRFSSVWVDEGYSVSIQSGEVSFIPREGELWQLLLQRLAERQKVLSGFAIMKPEVGRLLKFLRAQYPSTFGLQRKSGA